jgi:hypothetical protein
MKTYIRTCKLSFLQNIQISNMAVSTVGSNISSDHSDHNDDFLHEYKCLKCAELERQLKESSLQLIIKLLYIQISSVSSSSVTMNTTFNNVGCE